MAEQQLQVDGAHYFAFSRVFEDNKRLCGVCGRKYAEGAHIEITTLKQFTSYVCPNDHGDGGHSGLWTGALIPEFRTTTQHLCSCGAELVEEDKERWLLAWEMQEQPGSSWRNVSVMRSRSAAESQQRGLLDLVEQGELIRNITLVEVA